MQTDPTVDGPITTPSSPSRREQISAMTSQVGVDLLLLFVVATLRVNVARLLCVTDPQELHDTLTASIAMQFDSAPLFAAARTEIFALASSGETTLEDGATNPW